VADIIEFRRPEKPDPHMSGPARCVGCQHDWTAVAPVGTTELECPSCGMMKGLYRYPVTADANDLVFRCQCGSEALTAYYRNGKFRLQCMSCGISQTEAIFGG
jgi:ribosomal protein S27E